MPAGKRLHEDAFSPFPTFNQSADIYMDMFKYRKIHYQKKSYI